METSKDGWDVVILDGTGKAPDDSQQLRDELARRRLRVKLMIVPPPLVSVSPTVVNEEAKRARYCVILLKMRRSTPIGETAYFIVPTPRTLRQGKAGGFADAKIPMETVESGKLGGDLAGLADRVERRLRS
jgi:hypothetical protein